MEVAQKQEAALHQASQDNQQNKQLELLQKQIATQQKMIELLMAQMKKQPPAGGVAVEKLLGFTGRSSLLSL